MASSIPALAASLENVAVRLRRLQAGLGCADTVINVLRDLEDEDEIEEASQKLLTAPCIWFAVGPCGFHGSIGFMAAMGAGWNPEPPPK